jgi:hypothetical protein
MLAKRRSISAKSITADISSTRRGSALCSSQCRAAMSYPPSCNHRLRSKRQPRIMRVPVGSSTSAHKVITRCHSGSAPGPCFTSGRSAVENQSLLNRAFHRPPLLKCAPCPLCCHSFWRVYVRLPCRFRKYFRRRCRLTPKRIRHELTWRLDVSAYAAAVRRCSDRTIAAGPGKQKQLGQRRKVQCERVNTSLRVRP